MLKIKTQIITSLTLITLTLLTNSQPCWKNSHKRKSKSFPNTCKPEEEQSGTLCYPKCLPNYTGVGPLCWLKDSTIPREQGLLSKDICEKTHKKICEEFFFLWFPICPLNYKSIGYFCSKNEALSYGRTAGTFLECEENFENSGGYCYEKCENGFWGDAGLCWKNECPKGMEKCGEILCVKDTLECTKEILILTKQVLVFVKSVLDLTNFDNTLDLVIGLVSASSSGVGIFDALGKEICKDERVLARQMLVI